MPLGPTLTLARFVARSQPDATPSPVLHEARRAILNWTGCAVGASRHATVGNAIAALSPFVGPPRATVPGRGERIDVLHAALMNGNTSHTFDFDDTHSEDGDPPGRSGRVGPPRARGVPRRSAHRIMPSRPSLIGADRRGSSA